MKKDVIKDTFLELVAVLDEAINHDPGSYSWERVSNYRGFVDTLEGKEYRKMKLLFSSLLQARSMFLEARRRNDHEALKTFAKEIQTSAKLLRSEVIDLLYYLSRKQQKSDRPRVKYPRP